MKSKFRKDLKFVNSPNHEIHEIKCPMNKNDFTDTVVINDPSKVWCISSRLIILYLKVNLQIL